MPRSRLSIGRSTRGLLLLVLTLVVIVGGMVATPSARADSTLLYQKDFESPFVSVAQTCASDLSQQSVNTVFGPEFKEQNTVEILLVQGPADRYSDPTGTGGNYALGFLATVNDDKLALTFDSQGHPFVNVRADISPIGADSCGIPGPSTPTFALSLVNTPSGVFTFGSGTVLSNSTITGLAPTNAYTFNWATRVASLSTTGATNGIVTVVFDLTAGGYAALDNLIITAGDAPATLPTATSQTVNGLEDTDLLVTLAGSDPESDPLAYKITTLPGAGTLYQANPDNTRGAQITSVPTSVTNTSNKVIFVPAANASGTPYATFGFKVNDGVFDSSTATVTVNITAVNDLPTVTDVTDRSVNLNTSTGPINFTIGDVETAIGSLTVNASSSNATLVPSANVVLGGSGANRTVTATPAANQSGTATIALQVSDGSTTTTETFLLTVNPNSNSPTISDIADQSIDEDTATGTLAFTIGDTDTAIGSLVVTSSSSNTTLVPNANIVIGGSDANRTVTVTPAANQAGTAIITLQVSDGTYSATDTFVLTVNPIPDIPTIGTYSASSIELSRNGVFVPSAAPAVTQRIVASTSRDFKGTLAVDLATGTLRVTNAYPAGQYPITVTAFSFDGTTTTETLDLTVTTPSVCNYGRFSPATNLTGLSANPIGVAVSDFNSDGSQDLAVASWGGSTLSIYLGNGAGGFGSPALMASGARPWGVVAHDFNGDGKQDLVTPNSFGSNVSIYLGNGTGGFSAPTSYGAGTAPYAVAVSDFNHDTKSDLVVANLNSSNLSVLLGDGTGSFGAATTINLGTRPHNVNVGDFNGDGHTDLVTANIDAGTVFVLFGNGAGGFGAPNSFTVGASPIFVGVNDFDEDGDQDIAVSNFGSGTISVLLSNGNGTFAPKTDFTVGSGATGVAVGDFNRDGHIDIVSTAQTSARLAVLLGTGTGSFGAPTNFTIGTNAWPPAVADFNADGKQDLVVPNFGANSVSILAGNCAPTVSDIADQTTNEDTPTGAINFTIGDAETAANSLVVTGTSSNTTLVPNANIVVSNSGTNRTVTITPVANQAGTATITITVSDGVVSVSDTFVLTVTAVNDAPTISNIADRSTNEDVSTGSIAFTVGDVDTAVASLTVTGSSSDTTLVPNTNIVFGGSGTNRTVTITPAASRSGTTTITITVSDGTSTASDTFVLTVNAVNDTPTISNITNETTTEDTATSAIAFTIGDLETAAGSLTVSGSSSNTTLIPNANIVFGGTDANRTVTVTPAANQSGTATITITVSDGGLTASDTFVLIVNPVDDAPTISDITEQSVGEDGSTGAIAFTIGDAETGTSSLTVTVSSSDQTLVPDANIVVSGSGANRTVTVTPSANQSGMATITITISDGSLTTSDTFVLTVTSVNDAPTISDITDQSTTEDTATGALSFTVADAETAATSLTVTVSSSDQTLVPDANIVVSGSGANRTVTVTPAANQSGTATITITVSDGKLTTSDTFALTISTVNDAPTLDTIADLLMPESSPAQTVNLAGITAGPADEATQTLSVTATSSNPNLIPDPTVIYTSPDAAGTLSFTPVAGMHGSATITVTVMDSGSSVTPNINTVTRTFVVFVGSVNNRPTLSEISDLELVEDAGVQTVNLSGIGAGSAIESGQSLTVTATSDNPALIPSPAVTYTSPDAAGTLSFTPVANLSGAATITVTVQDDGGTAGGGIDTTALSFEVTVTPVNDAPGFTSGPDQSVMSSAGTQTVTAWATGFTPGPADEAGQTLLAYEVVGNSNPAIFAAGPAIDQAGTLTYTPQVGASGTATIEVVVRDSGGTANGGVDTSEVQSFTVTVEPLFTIYLPLVGSTGMPDLVISEVSVTPSGSNHSAGEAVEISIVVENRGSAPATPFWVDLSINPDSPPTAANQPWNEHCTLSLCYGLVWGVQGLAPGQRITLTSTALARGQSSWPGSFAAGTTDLYVYVDSYNQGMASGAIAESDETNNLFYLGGLTVTGPNPSGLGAQTGSDPAPSSLSQSTIPGLPARPVSTQK